MNYNRLPSINALILPTSTVNELKIQVDFRFGKEEDAKNHN